MGNTYKRIKKCILCDGKNNESHLIMKCPELAVVRNATNIYDFIERNKQINDDEGHKLLKEFLNPKKNIRATLEIRVQDIAHILKSWEAKVKTLEGGDETMCYCKSTNVIKRPMVQCDMCSDWFHFECAGLGHDFASLDEWFCQKCVRDTSDLSKLCTCADEFDPGRETIMCKGQCKALYHPECVGIDLTNMPVENINKWMCINCVN